MNNKSNFTKGITTFLLYCIILIAGGLIVTSLSIKLIELIKNVF